MKVLLFGELAEIAGWRARDDLGAPDIRRLRAALTAENPALGEALAEPGVRPVVNKVVVAWDAPLAEGDEAAFLPVFSGG